MLWYKAWLETRWRFICGLVILVLSAGAMVFGYPEVMKLMPMAPPVDASGELGRRIREAVDLAREYRGYVWSQWFRQNLPQTWTVFAVLLGTGGLVSQASGGAALFTLSLPVSRNRLLAVRAAAGLVELLILAIVPSLLIPLLSPGIGERYGLVSALVHGACLFLAGTLFFSLAFLLSTVFTDIWRPLLLALGIAMLLALFEQIGRDAAGYGIFRLMSGEAYFRTGELPWLGLGVSAALSVAMLYGATLSVARRDF